MADGGSELRMARADLAHNNLGLIRACIVRNPNLLDRTGLRKNRFDTLAKIFRLVIGADTYRDGRQRSCRRMLQTGLEVF